MNKKLRYLGYLFLLLFFVGLTMVNIWLVVIGSNLSVEQLWYLGFAVSIVYSMFFFKLSVFEIFFVGMALFIFGAALSIIGLVGVSEVIVRLSFVIFIIGLFFSFVESMGGSNLDGKK